MLRSLITLGFRRARAMRRLGRSPTPVSEVPGRGKSDPLESVSNGIGAGIRQDDTYPSQNTQDVMRNLFIYNAFRIRFITHRN